MALHAGVGRGPGHLNRLPQGSGAVTNPLTSSGKVAAAARCSAYFGSSGGNKQAIARNWHTSPVTLTKLGVTIGNGNIDIATAAETAVTANAITWKAWVEYPSGTYTALTWGSGGADSGAVAQLDTADSDELTLPTPIPANTDFWIWLTATSAGGIYFNHWQNTAKGEVANFGVSGVETAPGAGVTNIGTYSMPPLVIWSSTSTAPAMLIEGDSREAGFNDSSTVANALTLGVSTASAGYLQSGLTADALSDGAIYLNVSSGGSRAGNNAGNDWPHVWAMRKKILKFFSHHFLSLGFNDLCVDGSTAAATATALGACTSDILAANTYARIILPTIGPKSASTSGGWTSLADQTVNSDERTTHNTNVRAGTISGNNTGYLEVANLLDTSGKWTMGTGLRTVTDGTTNAGTGVMTSATANYSAADVGAGVAVTGAGGGGGLLKSWIKTFTNSTTVVANVVNTTVASNANTVIGCPTNDGLHPTPQIYRVPLNNGIPAAIAAKLLL